MNEKQLKYQNKVKLISFIFIVIGLLLVLLWSIKKNQTPETPVSNDRYLTITYGENGSSKYDYKCKNNDCVLSSQAGNYALVKDGTFHLINLSTKSDKEMSTLQSMTKNFMIAKDEFYGLIYTKTDTNAATFYESSKDRILFDGELNYEAMDKNEVRDYLTRLYPRGFFYKIKEEKGELYNLNTNEIVLEDVYGMVVDGTEFYIVSSKGVSLFKEDNSLETKLSDVKRVYPNVFEHQFVILDTDNNIKISTLDGEKSDKLVEVGEGKVQSINITNGIMRVIIEDKDYATNQKTHTYEYDFDNKKLNEIE